ncbi:Uncharacterised protein [Nocardia africana]|uniref:Uncharacterized protein n=1 Tax=Nocardia africana TaxID=134964 RepID=A0A378WXS8_9NOCA|nr:Uncharacterised protein [Nocardia africana]
MTTSSQHRAPAHSHPVRQGFAIGAVATRRPQM